MAIARLIPNKTNIMKDNTIDFPPFQALIKSRRILNKTT
jgi:hypothetical protein